MQSRSAWLRICLITESTFIFTWNTIIYIHDNDIFTTFFAYISIINSSNTSKNMLIKSFIILCSTSIVNYLKVILYCPQFRFMYLLCNEIHPNAKFILFYDLLQRCVILIIWSYAKHVPRTIKHIVKFEKKLQFLRFEIIQIDYSSFCTTPISSFFL